MFTLDELIVRPDDDLCSLLDQRVNLFLEKFNNVPTTAFISIDIYEELSDMFQKRDCFFINRLNAPPGQYKLHYQAPFGPIELKIKADVKTFLLVGIENTYAHLEFTNGIHRELWSDNSRRKIDSDFEEIVLENSC